MAKNTSVLIGQHFQDFISEEVASGRYTSASEVVRDSLRLLEDESNKRKKLEKLLQEGEDSGEAKPFDLETFKHRMSGKYVKHA